MRRVFHALPQVDSVRLKQYKIQEFAPAFRVIRSHGVTPDANELQQSIRAFPSPGQQVTTRNGRADLTRQFIRYGMMATAPHGYRVRLNSRAEFAPVGQWKST